MSSRVHGLAKLVLGLIEWSKDLLDLFSSHANARIGHCHFYQAVYLCTEVLWADIVDDIGTDFYHSPSGELDGIRDQIESHLLKALLIKLQVQIFDASELPIHFQRLIPDYGLHHWSKFEDCIVKRAILQSWRQFAFFKDALIKQIVCMPHQEPARD